MVHVFAKTMTYFKVKKLGLMKKPSVMTTYSVSVSAEVVGRAGGGVEKSKLYNSMAGLPTTLSTSLLTCL